MVASLVSARPFSTDNISSPGAVWPRSQGTPPLSPIFNAPRPSELSRHPQDPSICSGSTHPCSSARSLWDVLGIHQAGWIAGREPDEPDAGGIANRADGKAHSFTTPLV